MELEKIFILAELKARLSFKDRILLHLFRNYTYRIYAMGTKKGVDWHN